MICNTSAMFLVLLLLCFFLGSEADLKASDPAYVICNRECIVERNTCSNDCRLREELSNRVEIMHCLIECNDEYVECEAECTCVSKCSRDLKACTSRCNTHPFQNRWDRRQCRQDCIHEDEICQDLC